MWGPFDEAWVSVWERILVCLKGDARVCPAKKERIFLKRSLIQELLGQRKISTTSAAQYTAMNSQRTTRLRRTEKRRAAGGAACFLVGEFSDGLVDGVEGSKDLTSSAKLLISKRRR